MNKHILDRYKEISLSNYDIFDLLNKKIRILTYPELIKYKNINDVLYPNGCFILLYMAKPNYGHWCCVIKHHDNIEFFNPYGDGLPDDELSNIPAHFRKISNQSYPHLTWLLYNSGQPIEYNDNKFQKHGSGIATCGRHCVVRVSMKNLNLNEYAKFMKKIKRDLDIDYDDIVTLLTMNKKKIKI